MAKINNFILSGSGDKTITGDITYNEDSTNNANIIFVHGFKGFKDWGAHNLVASYFAEKGYRYIKFNLSHSGVTEKQPHEVTDMEAFSSNTISMELKDTDTVINYVAHTFPQQPIYLIGHSRGGGIVIVKAANDKRIDKIITWSAIADFNSLWKKEQEEEWLKEGRIFVENARTKEKMPLKKVLLEDYNANKQAFDIVNAATEVRIPWLILHGDEDVNVDFNAAQSLAQAQPAAMLKKIPGANHVYGVSHPYNENQLPPQLLEVCNKTLEFIEG